MAGLAEENSIIACHECGLIHQETMLNEKRTVLCERCGSPIYRERPDGLNKTLSVAIAAIPLFVVAHTFPFMTLNLGGREVITTLVSGPIALYRDGMWPLAILVIMVASIIPGLKLFCTIYTVISAKLNWLTPGYATLVALSKAISPWAMMEVFLLGVIVAWVKLKDIAAIGIDPGCWAFVGVILLLVLVDINLDPRRLWRLVAPQATTKTLEKLDGPQSERKILLDCHTCRQIQVVDINEHHPHCSRCHSSLHRRKPDAIARTWSLLVAATIMYLPANILPIMTVVSLGHGEADTILSGVKVLIQVGMWPVALLVFFASITVPMLKLIGLIYLLISVQKRSQKAPRDRTLIYRIIEGVGRWSMVDIFMISILVSMISFGNLASIVPGAGALCFAAVVIITMIASSCFEPRLIWDGLESEHGRKYQI